MVLNIFFCFLYFLLNLLSIIFTNWFLFILNLFAGIWSSSICNCRYGKKKLLNTNLFHWTKIYISRRKGSMAVTIYIDTRGGSAAAAGSRMECFVMIVNGFQPLAIIAKHSILDVAAALDPPLDTKHSLSHDNNLVPFYLWGIVTVLIREKV